MSKLVRLALLSVILFGSVAQAQRAPNILIILADDMGYGDLGCMGSELLETPHIDSLAESGTLCTQAYVSSPVCSPSRAGLITGRDPRRFGYQANLNQNSSRYATRPELLGLPPGEHTLADHLRAGGYATALIGKWHLGKGTGFHPLERGFDYFCGMLGGSHSYFPDPNRNALERNRNGLTEFSNPYLTDFFTDEGLAWLSRHETNSGDQPWFLFLSYNAPHGPMHATEEDLARFAHIRDAKRRTYAAMMYALDRGVGRIKDWLDSHDQGDNTLIVFFSDNGGATNNGSWNGMLSGVKGCLREGGIRVPMIWHWPGHVPAGQRYSQPVSSLDLLPTFLSAAALETLPLTPSLSHEDRNNQQKSNERYGAYDGVNLLPILNGEQLGSSRTLFWRLQGQAGILSGDYKLVRLSHRPATLFRVATDLGEENDLAGLEKARLRTLFSELGQWESLLPTVPLWGSSPYWSGQSAQHYDQWTVREEPR